MKSKRGSPYAVHVFGSNCQVPPTPCGGRAGELIGEAPARAWFVPPSAAGSRPGSRARLPGAATSQRHQRTDCHTTFRTW